MTKNVFFITYRIIILCNVHWPSLPTIRFFGNTSWVTWISAVIGGCFGFDVHTHRIWICEHVNSWIFIPSVFIEDLSECLNESRSSKSCEIFFKTLSTWPHFSPETAENHVPIKSQYTKTLRRRLNHPTIYSSLGFPNSFTSLVERFPLVRHRQRHAPNPIYMKNDWMSNNKYEVLALCSEFKRLQLKNYDEICLFVIIITQKYRAANLIVLILE